MDKDNTPAKSGPDSDSPTSKHKQLKDEKLAAALRANLRRRKQVAGALESADDKGSGA